VELVAASAATLVGRNTWPDWGSKTITFVRAATVRS
jgi:hypothetical protein